VIETVLGVQFERLPQFRNARAFGFVSADQIVGRTSRVAFSLDRDHWYLPRWERWLRRLE
jgi:hypothetical protein